MINEMNPEFVNSCLRGEPSAWESLVVSQGPRMRRMTWRYSQLRGEVEDLKQELFLKVFCGLKTFRCDTGDLSCWIIRIGRNIIMDRLRQVRSRPQCDASLELDELPLRCADPGPETHLLGDEATGRFRKVLRTLTPDLEETLVLRYVQDMIYQEIARSLGIPDGTVKSRIKRGREKLTDYYSTHRSGNRRKGSGGRRKAGHGCVEYGPAE